MANWIRAQQRLYKSAHVLKAYYESKLKVSLQLLTDRPDCVLEGDVLFNEAINVYGLWGFRPTRPLAREAADEMAKMCDAILGGLDRLDRNSEGLAQLERQLERSLSEIPSNVISLQSRLASRKAGNPAKDFSRRLILKRDCLIESPSSADIHKMAMELHSHSSRVAFVDFRDLDMEIRRSLAELLGLGAITIFVPDVLALSSSEQEILKALVFTRSTTRPLVMAGTLVGFSELRETPGVDLEFITVLSNAYIKLGRPFSEYKEQGLIHYFLDSLSESPS